MGRPLIGTLTADANGFARLWHYTCSHAAAKIVREGIIRPYPQPFLDWRKGIWLASYRSTKPGSEHCNRVLGFDWPIPAGHCNHTETAIPVRIHERDVVFWPDAKRIYPEAWERAIARRGTKPWLWWFTEQTIGIKEETA